ncbi:MAG: VCBS repeat-containing protein [Deltaproteobacteria bacterium]|nr:VCBS repeat-containing protein [Deltaproteobacteria bacterium]
MRVALIWAGVTAALISAPPAEAGFKRQALEVPGSVLWVTHGDLDGDGFTDLVVSYRRGSGPVAKRFLAVFFRGEDGYPARPQLAYEAPDRAAAFDVGDAVGDARDELVFLTSTGVFVQPFEGRKPKPATRLVAAPTLVSGPEAEDLITWDFLRRFPGRPAPMLMVPGRRGLRVYERRPGAEGKADTFEVWADLRLDLESYYDAESATYRRSGRGGSSGRPYSFRVTTVVPNLEWVDQTGDGRVDLVTYYEDRVALFPQREDGTLSPTPTYRHWFKVLTPDELASRDVQVSARVRDLDGDGVADLVLGKIGGGVTTLSTELRLHRGLKGGGFAEAPEQVFKDAGFAALSDFVDLDGDGALEMVHPLSEVSVMSMSRALLSQSLSLDVRVRERGEKGFFEPKPVQVLETSYGLDLSVGAAIKGAAPIFGLDFTGDGVPDALLSEGGDALALWAGKKGGAARFEDTHIRLEAPGSNTTQPIPARTNGGPTDLVVYYVAHKTLATRLFVFIRE